MKKKFKTLAKATNQNFELFLVSWTKLDDPIPSNQLLLNGYRFLRRYRNLFGGNYGFLLMKVFPAKKVSLQLPEDIEPIALEINLRVRKSVIVGF